MRNLGLVAACGLLLCGFCPAGAGDEVGEEGVHWSFQPPRPAALPGVVGQDWTQNPIDVFVLARLEKQGLSPSPAADRPTLIRRLSLDLLGLPPSLEGVERFECDPRPDAYERLVDRLLASPHFGERWGRHWLDLARYADSDGYDNDAPRPHAWRYRHWVIDALNRDLGFDQFSAQQLAGDLMPEPSVNQLVATGFQRNAPYNSEGGVDREEFRVRTVADWVNTVGTAWLGLTISCAECHSHKYDPMTQREFFGLFAFFDSTDEGLIDAPLPDSPEAKARVLELRPSPRKTHVHIRGNFLDKGEEVQPHTPSVLPPLKARGPTPDRLDLARWLFDPAHPLTARVAVNRMWQHLFGRALVTTVEDFGRQGEEPSHPDLLNYLALEFVKRGWSPKSMIRLIVASATYRQSSLTETTLQPDPENVLLGRQNRFRLEAEILRDSSLAASGLLNRELGGTSVQLLLPPDEAKAAKWKNVQASGPQRYRRGIYVFIQRAVPFPMFATFDAPDTHVTCARRYRSNTPIQALTLLNDPEFVESARALGRLGMQSVDGSLTDRLRRIYRRCLSRRPDEHETARLKELYEEQESLAGENPAFAGELVSDQPLSDGVAVEEAAAWMGVSRILLNLDEFVMRE